MSDIIVELKPLVSGHRQTSYGLTASKKGEPYYEQVLMIQNEYPVCIFHIDLLWDNTNRKYLEIHKRLSKGETVKARLDFVQVIERVNDET